MNNWFCNIHKVWHDGYCPYCFVRGAVNSSTEPISDESPKEAGEDDELWDEVAQIADNWDYDDDSSLQEFIKELKSKFHITKKSNTND